MLTECADFRKCGGYRPHLKWENNVCAFKCSSCAVEDCLHFFSFDNFKLHMDERHLFDYDIKMEVSDEMPLEEVKEFVPINKDCSLEVELENGEQQEGIYCADIIKVNNSDTLEEYVELPETEVKEEVELIIYDPEDDSVEDNFQGSNKTNNADSNENGDGSDFDMEEDIVQVDAVEYTKDQDITSAVIAGYEEHRLLWDENMPNAKNRRKREEALKEISDSIKKQIGVELQVENLRARIKRMRHKYRKQKIAMTAKTPYFPLWYFDKLEFLNGSIKLKPRNLMDSHGLSKEEPALPLPGLTDTQHIELIEVYKSFPCLWDVDHIGFRFPNKQQEALEKMLQSIKIKMKLNITEAELQEKINCIQYACTQEKHRKLLCELEKRDFEPSCKYYVNVSFLEPYVGPFKCPFCEDVFNGVDQYKLHKFKHDGSIPYTCAVCNHGFMESGNYKVHLRRHTRDLPYECEVCGKRSATSTDAKVHMRHHTGEKPYFCEICGRSFRTPSFFSKHMRRHLKKPSHKCTFCCKTFYENYKLQEHLKAHSNTRDKECTICGKAFTTAKYLRQHMQIHAEIKKYVCKICAKGFAQYAGLSGHMATHGTTMSGVFAEDRNCVT